MLLMTVGNFRAVTELFEKTALDPNVFCVKVVRSQFCRYSGAHRLIGRPHNLPLYSQTIVAKQFTPNAQQQSTHFCFA